MDDSDSRMIRACCKNDEAAWKSLVERYRGLIFSIPLNSFHLSGSDAEDIVQQVLIKLFENIRRLHRIESLPAWLIAVARNECLRASRECSHSQPLEMERERTLASTPQDLVEELYRMECEHRLARAFRRLDDASRSFLMALYAEDPTPSYAELSARLGRPLNSLGPTRSRCLKKMRKLYAETDASPMAPKLPGRHAGHHTSASALQNATG